MTQFSIDFKNKKDAQNLARAIRALQKEYAKIDRMKKDNKKSISINRRIELEMEIANLLNQGLNPMWAEFVN
jgi:hypothetical protein